MTTDHWHLAWYRAYRNELELDSGGLYPYSLSDPRFMWRGVDERCERHMDRIGLEWSSMTEDDRDLIRAVWVLTMQRSLDCVSRILGRTIK